MGFDYEKAQGDRMENKKEIARQREVRRFIEKVGKFPFNVLLEDVDGEKLPTEIVTADDHKEAIKKAQLLALGRPYNDASIKFNDSACKAKNTKTGKVYSFEDVAN
jgi:hypothetical protein